MAIEYPRRFPKTRGQVLFQSVVSALIVLPPLVWRLTSGRLVISLAVGGLALAAMALAYRGIRFLAIQEQRHAQPTPEMTFVFMLVSVYPLAISVFVLILLAEI